MRQTSLMPPSETERRDVEIDTIALSILLSVLSSAVVTDDNNRAAGRKKRLRPVERPGRIDKKKGEKKSSGQLVTVMALRALSNRFG